LDEANYGGIQFLQPKTSTVESIKVGEENMTDEVEEVTLTKRKKNQDEDEDEEGDENERGASDHNNDGDDDDDDDLTGLGKGRKSNKHRFSQLLEDDSDESGGEEAPGEEKDEDGEDEVYVDEKEEEEENHHIFDSQWNLADYLPDSVREFFEHAVYMYLHKPWEESQRVLLPIHLSTISSQRTHYEDIT
jgi:hypothetical protein